jgi:hypothetical protein
MFATHGTLRSVLKTVDAAGRTVESTTQSRVSSGEPRDATGEPIIVSFTEGKMQYFVDTEWMEYTTRLVDRCQNRRLFVTTKGYIGLGPKEMECGDLITVLGGFDSPSVLRPQNGDFKMCGESKTTKGDILLIKLNGGIAGYVDRACKERFQLIGECYTHGLMSNEAWNNNSILIEEFIII